MVCDAAMIVSLMMNGICCLWQEQNEYERRDAMRSDIRTEYWRNRVLEQQISQRRESMSSTKLVMEDYYYDPTKYAVFHNDTDSCNSNTECHMGTDDKKDNIVQRRKKLMMDKINALNKVTVGVGSTSMESTKTAAHLEQVSPIFPSSSVELPNNVSIPTIRQCRTYECDERYNPCGQHISLVDVDDDNGDDDDDDNDLVDIPLHKDVHYFT